MTWVETATLTCATGSGLMAGVFFAFSVSVMKALGRLPPEQGISAMQQINIVIVNPVFLSVFLGTAAACIAAIAGSAGDPESPARAWILAGGVLYLAGCLAVTILFNIPRNNRLAALNPSSEGAQDVWLDYLRTWTVWNHVRAVCSLASSVAFAVPYWLHF